MSAALKLDATAAGLPPLVIAELDRNAREVVRVALDQYNGRHNVNFWFWFRDRGVLRPGRSSITLAVKHLPALSDATAKAIAKARELGLLDDTVDGGVR